MESSTKNRQPIEKIREMTAYAFSSAQIASLTELGEGYFNVAYSVTLSNGQETILKIAPRPDSLLMTHEKNIMRSEVQSMRLVADKTQVPVAKVLFYDDSHSVCDADYFFMSKLEGKSLSSIAQEISETEKHSIYYALGKYNAKINGITGLKFGYFGQPAKQGVKWRSVFFSIVHDALNDARALNIDIGAAYSEVENLLADYGYCFEEVDTPRLVHWDLWEGNVFTKDGEITGLIDFERCLWADPLMEVGFRSYNQNTDFLSGYGIQEFTQAQRIRIVWYDLYAYLIPSMEYDYRHYENRDISDWAKTKLRETMDLLRNGAVH